MPVVLSRVSSWVLVLGLVSATGGAEELPELPADLAAGDVPQVLTPARLRQAQVDVAASVTVIDHEMIAAMGVRDVPELLRLVPGMMVTHESEAWHTWSANYHGTNLSDVRRLQVLVDGMSVYQPGLARVLWSDLALSIDDIDRIEVTRGPDAAAYGANSFSAIINIITTHPQDNTDNMVKVAGGTRDTADSGGRLVGHGQDSDWRLSFSTKSDSGFDHTRAGNEVHDDRRVGAVNWRAEYRPNAIDRLELQAGLSGGDKEIQPDDYNGILTRYEQDPVSETRNMNVLGRWQRDISPDHALQVQAYSQRTQTHNPFRACLDPILLSDELAALSAVDSQYAIGLLGAADPFAYIASLPPSVQPLAMNVLLRYAYFQSVSYTETCGNVDLAVRESRFDVEVQDTLKVNDRLRVVSGASYRLDAGSSAAYIDGQNDNEIRRLFAHGEYRVVDPLLLNLGAMLESDDISGTNLAPRAGLNWRIGDQQSLRVVSSRAFRTQDLYEQYAHTHISFGDLNPVYNDGVNSYTDRDLFLRQQSPGRLKPEEINSFEIGYFGYFAALRTEVDVRWFREHLSKLISDAINPFDFNANNDSSTQLTGIEWQAKRRLAAGSWLWASYAYIDNDSTNVIETKFTAQHSGSLAIAQRFSSQWNGSAALYVSRDQNIHTRTANHNFSRLDLRLARDIPLGGRTLQVAANTQCHFTDNPHIHGDNRYNDRVYGFLTMQLKF